MAAASVPPGCGAKKGGLMLAITTDMKAPKDVSILSLTIKSGTQIKHNILARVRPNGDVELPATIAIAEPDNPNETIRVRVIVFQESKPRVLRDVRTTIPRGGRTALLRLGLNFVNDGSGAGEIPAQLMPGAVGGSDAEFDPYSSVVSKCDLDSTVIDGECKSDYVDPETLPDFEESLVFGTGGKEACFRTDLCFATPTRVGVALGTAGVCSFPLGSRPPSALNLALSTRDTGECRPDGRCLIPLDQGSLGWRVSGANVELSPGTCNKLRAGAELVEGLGACTAKTESQPLCEGAAGPITPPRDASVPSDAGAGERVMPENFPTGVALLDTSMYMVSAQGLAVVKPGVPGQGIPGVLQQSGPRFITRAGTTIAIAEGSQKPTVGARGGGYVLPNGATSANRIDFPDAVEAVNSVAFLGAPTAAYVWGANPPAGTSGLFTSSDLGAALQGPVVSSGFVTSVARISQTEFLAAKDDGSITACRFIPELTCDPPRPTLNNARIDAMVVPTLPPQTAVYLQADAVWRAALGGASITAAKLVSNVAVAPFSSGGYLYPHGLVVSGTCVFFTTNSSVQWVKVEGTTPVGGVIAMTPNGVPLGLDVGLAENNQTFVYWALFAGLDRGGAYRAPFPIECTK